VAATTGPGLAVGVLEFGRRSLLWEDDLERRICSGISGHSGCQTPDTDHYRGDEGKRAYEDSGMHKGSFVFVGSG